MNIKTKAIVISTIKYQDKSLIVKSFTLSSGLKTYFVRDAFSSKKTNQKSAYFLPLTLLEIEANHKNKGTLEHFKEIRLAHSYQSIQTNVVKSTIALFVSEVLHNVIKEEEQNETLFTFLETAFLWLDNHDNVANFHLILMLEMTKFLGFYPDVSNLDFEFFDPKEGVFAPMMGINTLPKEQTNVFKKLLCLKFDSNQQLFTVYDRQTLLAILLDYYQMHLPEFKKPKSLEVLKEVFS